MFRALKSGEAELVVKRSRFIAVARTVQTRDEAKELVAALKKEHREARHVCSAFIADEKGLDFGYDDDGEPSGTAGKPIYQALESFEVKKSAIAIVRYFGGIKLGAGGLTHAYRDAATAVVEKCGVVTLERQAAYEVDCDGETYKKIQPVLYNMSCKVDKILFSDRVRFTVIAQAGLDVAGAICPFGANVMHVGDRFAEV
ncbi:MAG: YigZ family protein [Clostridiales bacterium]|nr:YigZ family protein [Clostridiales bacterium]